MRRLWLLGVLLLVGQGEALAISRADYAAHVARIRQRLPGPGFTIVVEPPFVVVGDEPQTMVAGRARHIVRWAVVRLKQAYFARDPKQVLTIWLFRDGQSYRRNNKKLFGETPDTPYGYYSRDRRALVMNIATGGGTLVHEIVHPFMEANFPGCPSWFNEGLGSLYEQSDEGPDGAIRGLTNWRLAGLQRAIERRGLPSFRQLMRQSAREFYADKNGTNYAQSRYLLYALQQRGLLRQYYQRFVAHRHRDPTGYLTLQQLLGERDMARWQRDWERWVLRLRFGGSR